MDFLFASPVLLLGAIAATPVVLVLALLRNRARLRAGMVGFFLGYFVLGSALASRFEEDAQAKGKCPDAGWGGPAAGGLLGSIVGVIAFEVGRRRTPSRTERARRS